MPDSGGEGPDGLANGPYAFKIFRIRMGRARDLGGLTPSPVARGRISRTGQLGTYRNRRQDRRFLHLAT
jgi:hypothetical protein